MSQNIFDRVVEAAGGSLQTVATRLKVSRQAVWFWREKGIPFDRAPEIEREFGISQEEIIADHIRRRAESRKSA